MAAVERAFNSRAHPANTARLEELAALRAEAAGLLGYGEAAPPLLPPLSCCQRSPPLVESHAAFVLEERMARTPAAVAAFLDGLARDLAPLAAADLAGLLARKQACRERGGGRKRACLTPPLLLLLLLLLPPGLQAEERAGSGPVSMADYRYYMEAELRDAYAVDHDALKAYFPLHTVLDGGARRPFRALVPPVSSSRCC